MKRQLTLLLGLSLSLMASTAVAQATDAAAERARIANERIAAETARRLASDVDSTESAANSDSVEASPVEANQAALPAGDGTVAAPVSEVSSTTVRGSQPASVSAAAESPAQPPEAPAMSSGSQPARAAERVAAPQAVGRSPQASAPVSDALGELERLGKLRDAGYVTDAEFERIKERILDQNF